MFGYKTKRTPHVFAAMSGGVDSSVSAALLLREGYRVTGAFIKGWHPPELPCTWRDDRRDAMRVCARLGIPFRTIDLSAEYKHAVADTMLAEYAAGRTPNPDVLCNQHIKFGAFLQRAREHGADYIATGHYAQVGTENGLYTLRRGVDVNKDQTYFLWTLGQDELARTFFPVGKYTKAEVRKRARQYAIPTADKHDSQGVCFLGQVNMRDFLKERLDTTPGDVLDTEGTVCGTHAGAALYTLGQRHGFTLAVNETQTSPRYVVARDLATNTITVAAAPRVATPAGNAVVLRAVQWIAGVAPDAGDYTAQIRHRQTPFTCTITYTENGDTVITMPTGEPFPAEGQSLVVYDEDVCLGGGIVDVIR